MLDNIHWLGHASFRLESGGKRRLPRPAQHR